MCSVGDAGSTSSSTVLCASTLSVAMDVDDRIADLLDSLRWHCLRGRAPQDRDEDRLRKLHRQLEVIINEEPDDHRRRRLRHILPAANCIREQLLFLRQCLHSSTPLSTAVYVSRAHVALSDITKQSEEEEYRKLATIVGVLDAVAENLVLEVDAFGVDCGAENREIRKLIASALTNLTFGNAQSKRRLCAYPNLIDYVIRVIDDSHKLAQVYAGLLRNLSWMADAEMSATLSPTVAALTRASLRAYRGNETKCLCATLSALWNLASHSRDNKKAICEQSGFIDMIIELLTTEAQHTTLVEPASGVLKYASIYLAAVGATQLLSTLALHKMVLRLVDLLNSPSFTIIGNALGVLSQLLAKDHQLRVHVRLNHKAMQLLNHLRNSTRDDIRNAVKTVLEYLNAADLSSAFAPPYSYPHTATSSTYHGDGMSSSYGGTSTDTAPFMDAPRRLKLRSAQSHAPPSLLTAGLSASEAAPSLFTFPAARCAATMQHGFAPRPGERQPQQHFSSLPRHYFQQSKYTEVTSSRGEADLFSQPQPATSFAPTFAASMGLLGGQVQTESTSSQTSAYLPIGGAGAEMDDREEFEDSELARLDLRSDDPSFEVEDSVRCTRCTSTQSLSSLLPGEKSAWESCNNSAMNSNRLSPASATDLPDSPTQCMPLSHHDITIPSASDLTAKSSKIIAHDTEKPETSEEKAAEPDGRDDAQIADALSQLVDLELNVTGEDSPRGLKEEPTKQSSSADDDGDYGSFMGRADSELLNQSIEAAMPKRIETNEDLLADMIEQVQPKPSPRARRHPNNGRNFSSASTARIHSAASSMKTDDDDFLLQSIASVLPQSSSSRREHTGLGSPPKKVRAVTGDTARASTGPKRNLRAVVTKHTQTCLCVRDVTATSTQASSSESTCDYVAMSSSAALFNAALQSSSLVESAQTSEKVRDASSLRQQVSNEGSDTLSDDNYSRFGDEEETVDTKVPEDVVEEFQAEQLLIDCSVLLDTAHHGTAKPATRTSASRIAMPTWGTNLRNGSNTMPRNESSGAAALAAFASLKTVSSASALPDGDAASPKNASEKSLPLATRRSASANATFKTRLTPARSSRDAEKQTVVHASKMNKKSVNDSVNSRAAAHVASQRRIKPTVPPKPGVSTTNTSTTLAAPNANKLKSSRPAQPRVSISERNDSMNGIKSSSRDLEAVAHSGVPSSDFPLTTSAVTASRSVRVPPFNYRNPQEVTAAQRCDGNLLNVEKSAEVDNSSTCDLHDELKKKPNVKQMLVTTV